MTLDDFKKIYGQFFHCGDPSAFAEHVFRGFDINRDKKISFNEFLISLNITAKGNLEDKLRWTFHLYDIDEDKFISRDEMLEIVRVSKQKKKETFKQLLNNLSVDLFDGWSDYPMA